MCKKVVVFDLDDTLYKEIYYLQSAYRHIAFLVSNKGVPEDEVYQLLLDTYYQGGNAFETVIKKYGFRWFDLQWMLGVYRNHKPSITLDIETMETLNKLLVEGAILGIITDGRRFQQMNKIKALGLEKYISPTNIIINDEAEYMKPDTRSFRCFMEKYGSDYTYFYVGDNTSKDFIAPNSLGWESICLMDDGRNIHHQQFYHESTDNQLRKITRLSELLWV